MNPAGKLGSLFMTQAAKFHLSPVEMPMRLIRIWLIVWAIMYRHTIETVQVKYDF